MLSVTGTVLVETVLFETVSLVTIEKEPGCVGFHESMLSESDEVCIEEVLKLAGVDRTPEPPRLVAAQESRELAGSPVEPGARGLLGGGAPYVGNITEGSPAGVDVDKLAPPVSGDTMEDSVAGSDDVPIGLIEPPPTDILVLGREASLRARLDVSAEVLVIPPVVLAGLETDETVVLLLTSVLSEFNTSEELTT